VKSGGEDSQQQVVRGEGDVEKEGIKADDIARSMHGEYRV